MGLGRSWLLTNIFVIDSISLVMQTVWADSARSVSIGLEHLKHIFLNFNKLKDDQ